MTWDDDGEGAFSTTTVSPVPTNMGSRVKAVEPPVGLLVAAAVAVVVAYLTLVPGTPSAHLLGWALGSMVTIGLVTAFTAIDARRTNSSRYLPNPRLNQVRAAIVALGVLASAMHVWYYATHLAS